MRTLQEKFFEAPPTGIPLEKGRLLVSVPFNSDGYFDRTVILLVEHNSEGAMGFILNRPMHVYLKDVLPDLSGCRHVLHNGGPVGLDRLFIFIGMSSLRRMRSSWPRDSISAAAHRRSVPF